MAIKPEALTGTYLDNIRVSERSLAYVGGTIILSKEDAAFWGEYPPNEVILATGSVRKALMFMLRLHGMVFPGIIESSFSPDYKKETRRKRGLRRVSPAAPDYDAWVKKHIYNGNGSLPRDVKVLLGYLHGVPVYAQQQDGETASNEDPIEQARLKVEDLQPLYVADAKVDPKKGNVLIIGIDTVDGVRGENGVAHNLGKPLNEPDYPKKDPNKLYTPEELVELVEQQDAFLKDYIEKNYVEGAQAQHLNGIAVLDVVRGVVLVQEAVMLEQIYLASTIRTAKGDAGMGGAGIFQENINWKNFKPDELLAYFSDEYLRAYYKEIIATIPSEHVKTFIEFALYCHITGMPFEAIELALQKAAQER